jgi:hypothetical protein
MRGPWLVRYSARLVSSWLRHIRPRPKALGPRTRGDTPQVAGHPSRAKLTKSLRRYPLRDRPTLEEGKPWLSLGQ